VVEIVGAIQFLPLRQFGMPEIVRVARRLDDWEIADAPPALRRIIEDSEVVTSPSTVMALGNPPQRVVFASKDDRWLAQVQADRVAIHERKKPERPSFSHVVPKLQDFYRAVSSALDVEICGTEHAPELVEVTYKNQILAGDASDGVWSGMGDLSEVLVFFNSEGLAGTTGELDRMALALSFRLADDNGDFAGRLRVSAQPEARPDEPVDLRLQLVSRRYVRSASLEDVLEASHRDIVKSFTAITTDKMHKVWGRYQ
jgi:uncharacterized protein (TIGR04255 family)